MARLLATIRNREFTPGNAIAYDLLLDGPGQLSRQHTLVIPAGPITNATETAQIKTALLAVILALTGISLTADDILLINN